jgi:hypothetical protein
MEPLLLGHYDGIAQSLPLIAMALAAAALAWFMWRPSAAAVLSLQIVTVAVGVVGLTGIGLHLDGNETRELQTQPTLAGWDLMRETLTGNTPILAPGAMVLLALVGLAVTYRHPARPRHEWLDEQGES